MNRMAILVIIGIGLCTSTARAANISIKGSVGETLEGSDNYFLLNGPSGATFKTTTRGALNFLAQTPTTNYFLDTNYSYYKYFGPGTADTSLTWGTPAGSTFTVNHSGELATYNFIASWNRADATTTQLAQTGVAGGHGTIDTYVASGGLTYDLGRIDSISWTTQTSKVIFSDPTQPSSKDVSTSIGWKHDVSPTTTLNTFASFDWFGEDDAAESQRLFWKLMTGFDSKLSPRLTFSGHIGWTFANAYQNATGQAVAPLPGVILPFSQSGAGNSVIGDMSLTYQLFKLTTLSLIAAQAVVPTTFGQLQKSDTVGLTLAHTINSRSNVSFSTQFVFLPATSGNSVLGGQSSSSSDFFSASVNYNYQLTREWRTNLSYTYNERTDQSGSASSSTILASLVYDFTLMGNPTPINRALAERAKQRARESIGYVFSNFR